MRVEALVLLVLYFITTLSLVHLFNIPEFANPAETGKAQGTPHTWNPNPVSDGSLKHYINSTLSVSPANAPNLFPAKFIPVEVAFSSGTSRQ